MTYRMTPTRPDRKHLLSKHPELADWLAWLDLENKTPTTLENYTYTVVRFVERYNKSLLDATSSELLEFLRSLPVASRKTRRAHFSSFYEWALLNGVIEVSPMTRVPKIKQSPRKVIDVFEPWEQAALVQADPGRMTLLLGAGLRQAEARKLRGRDIFLDRECVIVRDGKGGKGRIVELDAVHIPAIADMMLTEGINPDDYIWFCRPGGHEIRRNVPVIEASFRGWWKECLAAAGVEYRKPHTTRHTFAAMNMRAGMRIERLQEQMGHESLSTTKDLYGHLSSADIRVDVALFGQLWRETVEVGA